MKLTGYRIQQIIISKFLLRGCIVRSADRLFASDYSKRDAPVSTPLSQYEFSQEGPR